ncbi:MAG: methyltransferase domain-containing protein [Candidatus Omnitrophota bacterium]
MKIRDSGMPDEQWWESFFQPAQLLHKMQITPDCKDVLEFGCGYGTFTIPAAQIISGQIYALDIEFQMLQRTKEKARKLGLNNVFCLQRDFMRNGTGFPDGSVDYVMLFNLLHAEEPGVLLREVLRVLKKKGKAGIIHWIYDSSTPRGPSLEIRPKPEQCLEWSQREGLVPVHDGIIDLPPYHYGLIVQKAM